MSRQSKDLTIALIKPPLIVLGFVAKTIYKLLFGRADKRLARRQEDQLANEIQQNLGFLFREYGGKIVPNSGVRFPLAFDYAVVTVEVGELLFRFVRGRGELTARVARKVSANDWHDVSLVIGAMKNPDEMQYRNFVSFSDLALLLKPNMLQIQEGLSPVRYADTEEHLANFEKFARVVTKQLETEINRRLYS